MAKPPAVPMTQLVPLDQIDPSPYQARKAIDPAALKDLASSMEKHGLRNAINVRVVKGRYELIAGERRWRAAQS